MGKPFSLQSPEQVAKEYGGNKQKIAQAAQMGQVDPTAAVLAGMFIDRMRSAQSLEQGAQPTVAQQVLAPPAPPASGAPPMGMAPPMAPQAPPMAPPMAPQAPPMGMASGGLTTLPIPDNMFDEQQYGGGGIVAFAKGDEVESDLMRLARIVSDPYASPEARNAAQKDLVSRRPPEAPTPLGRIGSSIYDFFSQTPEALALARAKLEGPDLLRKQADELTAASTLFSTVSSADRANNLEKADLLREKANAMERGGPTSTADPAAYDPYSPAAQAELTGLGGLAIDPRRAAQQMGVAAAPAAPAGALLYGVSAQPDLEALAPPPPPPVDRTVPQRGPHVDPVDAEVAKAVADVAEAAPVAKEDYFARLNALRGEAPTLSAGESLADQKKQDFNMALAQMGFGIAAGTSPNALTNIGAGLSGAVPGMQKAMDARRQTRRDAEKAEDARQQALYVSKGEDFRGSEEARRGDETLALRRVDQAATREQNIEENKLRRAQIDVSRAAVNAQGDTFSDRQLMRLVGAMPGGATPANIAAATREVMAAPNYRTPGIDALKAQVEPLRKAISQATFLNDTKQAAKLQTQLDEIYRTIMYQAQQETPGLSRDPPLTGGSAAATDPAIDLLVKKYSGGA